MREVHPETSFSLMVGAPIAASKRSREGLAARRAALAAHGIDVPDDVGPGGRLVGADDVLDAAAVGLDGPPRRDGRGPQLPGPAGHVAG